MTQVRPWSILFVLPMILLLALPVVALVFSSSPADILIGVKDPIFTPALWLSLWTSIISLFIIVLTGTPLAWRMSRSENPKFLSLLVDLPIVLPPAVIGIGLLMAFGRNSFAGETFGLQLAFTSAAVVLAQVVVAAPFYIQSAAAAFRRVDPELLQVARTLGQSPKGAFLKVALPIAMPGIIGGAALAWARALGEFGATLLFAGNLGGKTQTMPLAIYSALESDVRVALALALALAGISVFLLLSLRALPVFKVGSDK